MFPQIIRRTGVMLASLVAAFGAVAVVSPSAANASAGTCINATDGYICAHVNGDGGHVNSVGISRAKIMPDNDILLQTCNYNAWFFSYMPGGPVEDLGTESRAGCGYGRVWLEKDIDRDFPIGTQMCAKFYENGWDDFIGEKCVGLSKGHWFSW